MPGDGAEGTGVLSSFGRESSCDFRDQYVGRAWGADEYEGKTYWPGQIKMVRHLNRDFSEWLNEHTDELPVPKTDKSTQK
jgi:hypothetical protein